MLGEIGLFAAALVSLGSGETDAVTSVGTSIPGTVASIYAATLGAGDLLVGTVVGAEIARITLPSG